MTRFNIPPKFSRQILLLTAGICLLAATEDALAKNGGNSNDRGGMRSGDSSRNRDHGIKLSEKHAAKDRNADKHAEIHKNKTSGTTNASNNTPPKTGGKIPLDPGTGGKPTQTTTNGGKLPPNDPVGNTHPAAPGSAPGVVTVSNGVTKYDIPNGPGGVAVYSGSPGTIIVTNGKESKTLNGGSLTLSGNVVGVGAAQNIQVGARNGEGNTVVAIKPPAPAGAKPSVPTDIGHVTTGPGSITVTGSDLKTAGKAAGVIVAAPVAAATIIDMAIPAAVIGVVEGHPVKVVKEFVKEATGDVLDFFGF